MVDLHTEKEVPQLLNQKSQNGQNSVGIVGKVTKEGRQNFALNVASRAMSHPKKVMMKRKPPVQALNVASRAMSHPKKVMMKRKPRPVQPPPRCNDEDEQRDEINSDKA